MVLPGLAKRKSNIDVRLNGIRERLEEYCYDNVGELLAPAGKVSKSDLLTPMEEARKTADTQQKLKAMARQEIPPHLDKRHNLIYPTQMGTFGQQGPAFKERMKLKQYGPNTSRLGIQYPPLRGTSRSPEFLLGPDDFGFMAAREKIPRPRKGYQTLAYRKGRWSHTGIRRRAPTSVGPELLLYQFKRLLPIRSPFGVTGARFPEPGDGAKESADSVPGPGSYDITKVKIGRRIEAQHKLGHGASLPLPFHVHCSHRRNERCHTCKTEVWCLPSYYTVPGRKLYLCPLCYFVERKMALTLKPTTVAKFKRVMDCASIHTHFPYSDKVLTHASTQEIKWLARKEQYMHLHFPKRKDDATHVGVRHFAAP